MKKLWLTTAEVQMQPGDTQLGDTLGFMKVAMWASSSDDLHEKLTRYLEKYEWKLLGVENSEEVEDGFDYGEEVNQMIDEATKDENFIRLGTFYSYKPE